MNSLEFHDAQAPTAAPTQASPAVPAPLESLRMAKVRDDHLARKAIVYVRQSSPQQVAEHKESTEGQHALAELHIALRWPRGGVKVIDQDQGRSGQSAEG